MRDNPLARGFYTVTEAARLIEVGSARRIYGWLEGYPRREIGPLLTREYQPIDRRQELSFLDLIEVRFVEHFREHNVKVSTLRNAIANARRVFKEEKPLASNRIVFVTDGKDIFVEEVLKPTAKESNDTALWSLVTKQYEIYEFIRNRLIRSITFDLKTHLAKQWVPRPEQFPDIVIDPRIAYGQPIVPSKIPTGALFDAWEAEGHDTNAVAQWFDVPAAEVALATDFERLIRMPREALAA